MRISFCFRRSLYDIDKIIEAIHKRAASGHGFTILAVAEGAISKEDAALSKKELKEKIKKRKHPSVSYELADQIFQKTGIEVRITVPGHTQRGGSPCPYDRVLSTRLGAEAATLIMKKGIWLHGRYHQRQSQESTAW